MKSSYNIIRRSLLAFVISLAAQCGVAQTIDIEFKEGDAKVSIPSEVKDVTATKDGAHVSITSAATETEYTYRLKGKTSDGSLTISGSYKLTLKLAGVDITSTRGAAIDIECGKRIAVDLANGSVNSIADSKDGKQKAAMYFTGHPEFDGRGTLNITGNTKHAISAKEYMQIKKGFGTLNILSAAGDGLHCGKEKVVAWDEDMVANENEFFRCNGGAINIASCGGDCIDAGAYGCVLIKGGTLSLKVKAEDACGIKATNTFIIDGGQLNIEIPAHGSDGVYIQREARFNGGQIYIDVKGNGSKGIKGKLKAAGDYPDGGNVIFAGTKAEILARGGDLDEGSHCVGISVDGNLTCTNVVSVTSVADARGVTCDGTLQGEATQQHQHWYAHPYDFRYDMTAWFSLDVNDAELAAFVGDECRGVAQQHDGVHYMRIRSNSASGEAVTLKAFAEGEEMDIFTDDAIAFQSESVLGTPSSPISAYKKKEEPPQPVFYEVKVFSSDEKMGYVTGAGSYEEGTAVTVKAVANTGYHFVSWSDGSIDAEHTFTLGADTELTATFAPNQYTVRFMDGNAVVAETLQDYGSAIVIPEAPKKEGYKFVGWGDVDATVPDHDVTYTAQYEAIPVEPAIADGDYYLQHVATGLYLNAANDWGTQASLMDDGQLMTIEMLPDGRYTIDTHIGEGDEHYLTDLPDGAFVDHAATPFTIEALLDGTFAIRNELYLAKEGGVASFSLGTATEEAKWRFVTRDDICAAMQSATEHDPVNATSLLYDPHFSRMNQYLAMWEGDIPAIGGWSGKDDADTNAEKWGGNTQTFDTHQTVNLPNGTYKITMQGFYRYNNTSANTNEVADEAHADGTETINSFLYANAVEVPLKSIADEESVALTGFMPFSQHEAQLAFKTGAYHNELYVVVEDQTLTIGIRKTHHPGTDWTLWDNIQLFYYGTEWKPEPDAIVSAPATPHNPTIYGLDGIQRPRPSSGLNIVVGDNGTARKIHIMR